MILELKRATDYLKAMYQTENANKEDCENVKMHLNNISKKIKKVNLNCVKNFIEWEKTQYKENRGGVIMYDIKGQYKWLTESELFNYWLSK